MRVSEIFSASIKCSLCNNFFPVCVGFCLIVNFLSLNKLSEPYKYVYKYQSFLWFYNRSMKFFKN